MASTFRYDCVAGGGPIRNARSAISTWSASRSASEYTATVGMSSSRHVRITRTAISPRLAIRMRGSGTGLGSSCDDLAAVGTALGQHSLQRAARGAGIDAPPVWLGKTGPTKDDAR